MVEGLKLYGEERRGEEPCVNVNKREGQSDSECWLQVRLSNNEALYCLLLYLLYDKMLKVPERVQTQETGRFFLRNIMR